MAAPIAPDAPVTTTTFPARSVFMRKEDIAADYADGPPQWLWPFSASSACSFVGHTPKPSGNLVFGSFRSVTIPLSSSSAMIGVRSCSQQMVYHQPTLIFSQFALASSVVMAPIISVITLPRQIFQQESMESEDGAYGGFGASGRRLD